jgi:ketosteroid isomerase-like protein
MNVEHDSSVPLTTDPARHPFVFAESFNSGSGDAVDRVYEPDAVFVQPDGSGVTGDDRVAANGAFLAMGRPIEVTPRQVHVAGDIALMIVDWELGGEGPRVAGTATDVARRGADGRWRYVIDNPFGLASGQPQ